MSREKFAESCEKVFALASQALQEEAKRIEGVEGDSEHRPGVAGRSERHFQATLFEGLHRGDLRVTVEDAYYGFSDGKNAPTADLAE